MKTISDKSATREAAAAKTEAAETKITAAKVTEAKITAAKITAAADDRSPDAAPLPVVTWLPGIVLAWGAGLLVYAACRPDSRPHELVVAFSAWVAYGVFFGYACVLVGFEWCAAFAPLPAGVALFGMVRPEGQGVVIFFLMAWAVCMAVGGLLLFSRRIPPLGAVVLWVGLPVMVVVLSVYGQVAGAIALLVMIWIMVAMLCVAIAACGSFLRSIFYGHVAALLDDIPRRFWPARFTLRDLFKWTTWFAVIFAGLGALRPSGETWVLGSGCSLAAIAVAYLVVRLREVWLQFAERAKNRREGST